jgi:hypothetical protein
LPFLQRSRSLHVCYAIQRIQALREVNADVNALLTALEKGLQTEEYWASSLAINPPKSIRLDTLKDDVFLCRLAERIAPRLAELLAGREACTGSYPMLANDEKAGHLTKEQTALAASMTE